MHWVVQDNIYSPQNLGLLLRALESAEIDHTLVTIKRGASSIEPDIDPAGRVFVCGAIKMASVAQSKGWTPGSLLNTNFRHDVWVEHLGDELLNVDARTSTLSELVLNGTAFVRPIEDNKAFTGQVFGPDAFADWKRDTPALHDIEVIASPVKKIYREYRLFFVAGAYVSGSLYKQAGQPLASADVDPETVDYATKIASIWQPAEAFVVDVALTDDGWRVIEFNNINSSGFYASDVQRLVAAVEATFG